MLNDRWLSVAAINSVLKKYGLEEIDETRYLDIFGFPVINYYKRLGFDFEKDPFEVVGTEFIREYESRMFDAQLFNGVKGVLEDLDKSGFAQSILSAGKQKMLEDLIVHHNIDKYFMRVVGQDNHYAFGKSEAGKKWIGELGIDPGEVVMVGDTLHDADVADSMNVNCVLIPNGHAKRSTLETAGGIVLDHVADLLPWARAKSLL